MASVRETLLSYPGLADAGGFLEKVLTDRSLQGGSEYTVSISSQVSLAAADIYRFIGGLPDFTEYKLSESYPRAWYNSMAKSLYIENGEPEKAANTGKRIIVPRGKAGQSW